MAILKKGLSGEPVRRLQKALGVGADGQFGPGTETALKAWQKDHGLKTDGIAGPDTFAAMGLHELILLQNGARGDLVKQLQTKLGLEADGVFGDDTEEALEDYQSENGLEVDGVAGPATLAQMKVFKDITAETVKLSQIPANSPEIVIPMPEITLPTSAPVIVGTAPVPDQPVFKTASSDITSSIWNTIKGAFGKS
jgi:peptidoglycan hydrolase-like protein with peptidoglycan-binding domain